MNIRVIYLMDELAYCAVFDGEVHGKDLRWKVYVPDRYVISENGQHRLTDAAAEFLKPIAELSIELTAAKVVSQSA